MIIKLNETQKAKCLRLLDVKESNISAVEIYIDYLNNHFSDITKTDMEILGRKHNRATSFYKAFLHKLDIKENDREFASINKDTHIDKMAFLNKDEYLNDEYHKNIGPINLKEGSYEFRTLCYLPYEGFVYDEIEVNNELYQEHTPFGFFDVRFPYLALLKDDEIWMSIIPHEINTMKKAINEAHGRVLVLGLGLGYYLYNILLKNDVKCVDVIELDKNIISLFNKHLIDEFPHKEKINIIHADAIEYLKTKRNYDYVFVDIYHNVHDGEMLYLKVIEKEEIQNMRFSYWIEDSLLAMLRRQILTVFEENLDGYSDIDYVKYQNENDQIINAIYKITKKYVVDSFAKLHNLLDDDSIRNIAKKIIKEIN